MKIFFDENGDKSCASAVPTSFSKIYSQAAYSKKKIKSGEWRSSVHRYPGECGKPLSERTLRRKRDSAARILKYEKAARKYTYLCENPKARVIYKNDEQFILVRGEKGKFTGEKVVF